MPNFFTENSDIQFHFNRIDIKEVVDIAEDNYEQAKEFNFAPHNYEDAKENYYKVLEIIGDISGNYINERSSGVDEEGAHFVDGKVIYANGTLENLKRLSQADLMGMILPRRFGGLNFPFTMYMIGIEMVSRADASLMNIFGLQDIGDTINKFGTEEQRAKYLPKFCTGEHTGAMALTEPDAGSDLQAVKIHAYQDENGQWRLRGMKRFITNGNGDVLLVLARSEPGTKDGRGLSMFACHADSTVKVRRIENKLGIHGSPTCELQFNDTPCELVGQRKLGLIKYVIDLMFRARMGVSAQALGVSQAAYEEALKYAKEREQFGKPIYDIPVVTNMLIDMRVSLETCRSLFYNAAQCVDLKEKIDEKINKLKAKGEPFTEENKKLKELTKLANFLTPLSKYTITEASNKITYDSLQIHGGTGYMKEFKVERLARDARITNIYEGTSQLQIVAAIGGVINDILKDHFAQKAAKEYKGALQRLNNYLKEIRVIFEDSLHYVIEKKDSTFQDVAAKDLVELYSYLYIGYLVLEEAEEDSRKVFIANRYIINSLSNAQKNAASIKNELFNDLLHADKILV
ncbi:MAG: acyl-CoA dehydrogenase family protein [Melioribacteraceae bacterium]|nr:acyl-CoA dehydrogenase family protein [Melioribacteraceae bacterium]